MFEYLAWFQATFPLMTAGFALVLGLLIGSFLNVVIFRYPRAMQYETREEALAFLDEEGDGDETVSAAVTSLREKLLGEKPFGIVWPGSHCPNCGHAIKAWENIPVISWLFLRGRCSGCGTPISLRYPAIELLCGVLSMVVIIQLGLNPAGITALGFTWVLLALAMIDYDTTFLPDTMTLPLMWAGLILGVFSVHADLSSAVIGAAAGYLALWSVFQLFKLVTGKDGMGYGDFKLLAALGAWLGWQALPLIVILSSLAGSIIGGTLIALGRDKDHPIPFGPYLAIAGWIALLWGDKITTQYLQFLDHG